MSAWMCSNTHVNGIVLLALMPTRIGGMQMMREFTNGSGRVVNIERESGQALAGLQELGEMLVRANNTSIRARYGARAAKEERFDFKLDLKAKTPDVATGLQMLDCFDYQACEYHGWKNSAAKRFIDSLRERLCRYVPGYDEAQGWPWEG